MVDSGADVTTSHHWFGADAPMSQEPSPWKLARATGYALRYCGVRELDLSVAARRVRVKFVLTDVMYPVVTLAKLTEQGFKVECGQQARLVGMNSRPDRLCGIAAKIWDLQDFRSSSIPQSRRRRERRGQTGASS